MKIPLIKILGIRNSSPQAGGKVAVVVMTRADHAAMHEGAKKDIEKIAQAAGVEMPKTARIYAKRGIMRQQEAGIKELDKLLKEIGLSKDRESVMVQAGIATGYANAMYHSNLMTKEELKDVIEVIGHAGDKAVHRIEAENRPFWSYILGKGVRA